MESPFPSLLDLAWKLLKSPANNLRLPFIQPNAQFIGGIAWIALLFSFSLIFLGILFSKDLTKS